MFTLRIVFVGLIAILGDSGDPGQRTAVLIDDEEHTPIAILLQGDCSGEVCHHGSGPTLERARDAIVDGFQPAMLWDLDGMDLRLQRFVESAVVDAGGRGMTRSGWAAFPRGLDEVSDRTWVPDLPTILGGGPPSPRQSCYLTADAFGRGEGWDCPAASRFGFNAGTLANCHMAHDPAAEHAPDGGSCAELASPDQVGPVEVPLFQIGPHYRQAMGDTTVLELRIHEEEVSLEGFVWEEQRLLTAGLRPRQGEEVVTLVLMNEPLVPAATVGVAPTGGGSHDHFAGFYGIFDLPEELIEAHTPESVSGQHATVHPGLCEPYLRCIDELFHSGPRALFLEMQEEGTESAMMVADSLMVMSVPHGASECDNSTSGP